MNGEARTGGGASSAAAGEARLVEVCTGEVAIGGPPDTLVASALGSCVAVAALDRVRRRGGIAHVMLPGAAPPGAGGAALRYAENAIEELLGRLRTGTGVRGELELFLAGAGNVLERPDDTVCSRNVASVLGILERRGVRVRASSLGGTQRRRLVLDLASGAVRCAVGDGPEEPLAGAAP